MSTFDNPIIEALAPDLFNLISDADISANNCDSDEAFGHTISTLGQIQIFASIFNEEFFEGQLPDFAVMLSDDRPYAGYMASDAFHDNDGGAVSVIFFNHVALHQMQPREAFTQMAMFMASLWAIKVAGAKRASSAESDEQYVFALGSIFDFIGIDTLNLEARSDDETAASYQIVDGGKFDQLANALIEDDMTMDWPEGAYRSGLGLICRFSGNASISKNSTTPNSASR